MAASRLLWRSRLARPEQTSPEGDWSTWLYVAGRGAGKTRTAAEWVADKATSEVCRIAIVAPTFPDARDVCIEGDSGLLSVVKRYRVLQNWNRSQGSMRLTNGSQIKIFSGEEPERLRGPQHHYAWVDELAAITKAREAWDQLKFGLRLGSHPQTIVTTTPKPTPLMRELLNRNDGSIVITRGATFDNKANLAPDALRELMARYENTRLGMQELYGVMLEDAEGALWTVKILDDNRVAALPDDVVRRVISVDPAVTSNDSSDETGIVIVSRDRKGHGYVEGDYSMRGTPMEWAKKVVDAFDYYECDNIIVEVNQGGELVTQTLRTIRPDLPIKEIRATKGKRLRAEPISSLYEQGRVHHVGNFETLETQMTTWTPDDTKSPDRLDALVHGLTDLMNAGGTEAYLRSLAVLCDCGFPNIKGSIVCSECGAELKAG